MKKGKWILKVMAAQLISGNKIYLINTSNNRCVKIIY